VCHYLLNLTSANTIFLKRSSSTLAAAILTLSKMILSSFSANPKPTIDYDETLFDLSDFYECLEDLWILFLASVNEKESFKVYINVVVFFLQKIIQIFLTFSYKKKNFRNKNTIILAVTLNELIRIDLLIYTMNFHQILNIIYQKKVCRLFIYRLNMREIEHVVLLNF
jgi:hypothetical protein